MGPCTAYEYLANNEALRGLFLARQRRKGPDRVEPGQRDGAPNYRPRFTDRFGSLLDVVETMPVT